MSQPQISQLMLLRSFLTVGSGYVLSTISFFAIPVVLGFAFFPEFVEFLDLDVATQENIMANEPEKAIPNLMFWSFVGLNVLACLGIGWYVVKTAPFAQFPHAVFLTVLMFISFLQMLIEDPPAKKSMTIVYMIAFPLAILIGANWTRGKLLPEESTGDVD